MPDEDQRRYLFAAIDRATRWVYVEILPEKSAACAQGFLTNLIQATAFKIIKILTDNGKEFTDRFCDTGERDPTGKHRFDRNCHAQYLGHRLIPLRHRQSNGMIEGFNGRISEVLATNRFRSGWRLAGTPQRYVNVYIYHTQQRSLGHVCPVEALEQWRLNQPSYSFLKLVILWGLTPGKNGFRSSPLSRRRHRLPLARSPWDKLASTPIFRVRGGQPRAGKKGCLVNLIAPAVARQDQNRSEYRDEQAHFGCLSDGAGGARYGGRDDYGAGGVDGRFRGLRRQ